MPQLAGEAVLSDKSCFSKFLNFGLFLQALVVRIEFLELFSCWGMAWNWPGTPREWILTWMTNHVKNMLHMPTQGYAFPHWISNQSMIINLALCWPRITLLAWRIYALRVTLISTLASRSIRFAASEAKFWIRKWLSCPEEQFNQIDRVFHTFSI